MKQSVRYLYLIGKAAKKQEADEDGLFMCYFKQYLTELFTQYEDIFRVDVPNDFLIRYLVGSFAETVKWWVAEDTKHSPEEVAGYYMKVLQMFH